MGTGWEFVIGPGIALLVVAFLALMLRWTFSRGHSLVERRSAPGHEDEYGSLVAVASPGSVVEAEILRRRLLDSGIRATLAATLDGPRVLVFPEEARAARALLR